MSLLLRIYVLDEELDHKRRSSNRNSSSKTATRIITIIIQFFCVHTRRRRANEHCIHAQFNLCCYEGKKKYTILCICAFVGIKSAAEFLVCINVSYASLFWCTHTLVLNELEQLTQAHRTNTHTRAPWKWISKASVSEVWSFDTRVLSVCTVLPNSLCSQFKICTFFVYLHDFSWIFYKLLNVFLDYWLFFRIIVWDFFFRRKLTQF